MRTRENDTKLRKKQILDSARKLFRSKGYFGTTMDDIAADVGGVRGSL